MPWCVSGKVGLITGASCGLGREITRRLATSHGMTLVCVSRRDWAADLPEGCRGMTADIRSGAACDQLLRHVRQELGPVSVLVNCAGVTQNKLHAVSSDADYDVVMDTNVRGALNVTRAALRHGGLLQGGGGSVVHIGSTVGLTGNKGQVLYAASKAALSAASKSWAKEYGAKNIRFNVVAPGLIEGGGMGATLSDAQREAWRQSCPLGRLATVEDVADVVVSVLLSSYVNGQTIAVDGGAS
ncbi:3-oxoacyl-[acyl-carrier protein] reductase [Strigomonas culicis]|uniref:3-oxoacyl-[acyl-carrier protein] reductase n=1 Tax=Strigomonas culicis TaxID=28005 RepID=S9V1N5_9TRYP|nr:3-oxoacyl-acyl-carrier-protein reductase [Strigomonas culicis]EPY19736.1 3-oxoacyl-[acyl-carrier protein] reductase [Strigomonas culicis]EPY20811.1 3-oxoacyl-[acyl-carrier protein] reductase [Strigomonas culicis]|eukprot:EPY19736.1 3-oxoacyl-[acyl-carrier protein] reductase [Strigomonas culicis]